MEFSLVRSAMFNQSLSTSRIRLRSDKINTPVTIAVVADLHSCDYGKGQKELVNAVLTEKPDIILLVGDFFDDDIPPEKAVEFLAGISGKASCFYVAGNHEFRSGRVDGFKQTVKSYNVFVLNGGFADVKTRGQTIRICGIDDPDTDKIKNQSKPYETQKKALKSALQSDLYRILLAHRPERIKEYQELSPDLVVSGHAHGGQWRLPLILKNGLYAPNQGLFPKYTSGLYDLSKTKLVVSRGLARETTRIPRIFNRPEIVIITLEQEKP